MAIPLTVNEKKDVLNPMSVTFEERKKQMAQEDEKQAEQAKRDKFSPFSRWTQFNLEQTQKMMWLQLKHPKAAALLSFLVDQMDNYNAVMCSYKVIQELLGISEPTVVRSVRVLKENGFIAVLKSGTSNVYAVNDSVFWKSWGNNQKYSKFPANVVLSMSEQEKDYQLSFSDLETDKLKSVSLKSSNQDEPQDPWGIDN